MIGRFIKYLRGLPVGIKLALALSLMIMAGASAMISLVHRMAYERVEITVRRTISNDLWHVKDYLRNTCATVDEQDRDLLEAILHFSPGRAPSQSIAYLVEPDGRVFAGALYPAGILPGPEDLAPLAGRADGFHTVVRADDRLFLRYQAEPVSGRLLVVQLSDAEAMAVFRRFGRIVALGTLMMALIVALGATWLVSRVVARPLRLLARQAQRVADGEMIPPDALPRFDELGRLSQALHKMTVTSLEMIDNAERNERRFRRLFENSREAVFIAGGEGPGDMNPAGVELFGYESARDLGEHLLRSNLFAHQEQRAEYLELLHRKGYVIDYPVPMRRKNGEVFQALISATVVEDGSRFGIIRDVTESTKAEALLRASEARYRRLVENAPSIVYRWSIAEKRFEYLNKAVYNITGRMPQRIIEDNNLLISAIPEDMRSRVVKHWFDQMSGNGPEIREQQFALYDRFGGIHWIMDRSILVRDENGEPIYLEGIGTEITRRILLEDALRQGQRISEATLAGLPVPVAVLDRDHRVIQWNRAMERISGTAASEILGSRHHWSPFYKEARPTLADLVLERDYDAMEKFFGDKGLRRSPLVEGSIECEDFIWGETGHGRHLFIYAAPIHDEQGRVIRAVETLIDVTEQKNLEQELRLLSVTDELTGLYNKRFFYATLLREMEIARRFDQPLTLLMMDLDHFKDYNDSYGHLEGDRALAKFAEVIRGVVRATDLPCRYGGEEFAVLLPRTAVDEAVGVAERLRLAVADMVLTPLSGGGTRCRCGITVSLGAAGLEPGMDQDQLVRAADKALYRAKERGRNRVCRSNRNAQLQLGLSAASQ